MKVFLGGTCNGSKWRDRIIPMLDFDYFNPVVDDWTEECMERERQERPSCDFCLYVITPLMTGVYSIAEAVDDSNKRPEKTVFVVLNSDVWGFSDGVWEFSDGEMKSLENVSRMIASNGGHVFDNLKSAAMWMNAVCIYKNRFGRKIDNVYVPRKQNPIAGITSHQKEKE